MILLLLGIRIQCIHIFTIEGGRKKGETGVKMKNGENGVEVGGWGMRCVDEWGGVGTGTWIS